MKVVIKIECETISEIYSHLAKVKEDIQVEARKQRLIPISDAFDKKVAHYDNNCYGEHTVRITPEL